MPKADSAMRDHACIEHILRYCMQVNEALDSIECSKERFLSSHIHQNAVAMCILQIGELTKQLSSDFTTQHRMIPWNLMAKTRDLYAHHYGVIDFEMVWDTAVNDLPGVADFCRNYLSAASLSNQ